MVPMTVLARPFFFDWGGRYCLLLVHVTTLVRVRLSSLSLIHWCTFERRRIDLLVIRLIDSVLMVPLGRLLLRGWSLLFKAVLEVKVIVLFFVVVVPMPLSVALGLEVARRWTVS